MLKNFCESLILPACESDVLNKWFACVYQIKNKPCLFIGKSIKRFLHDENGLIAASSIGCLKPPAGSGNILECIPSHLPCDIDVFPFQDIFYVEVLWANKESQVRCSRIAKNMRCFCKNYNHQEKQLSQAFYVSQQSNKS